MTLIQQIKQDQLAARKSKDAVASSLLTTLIGEAEMVGKTAGNRETTDEEVIAVVKKFVKNINETVVVVTKSETIADLVKERQLLEKYLPLQLTRLDIEKFLAKTKHEISAGPKDMGKLLATLKATYPGQYDGKMASEVAKALLQQPSL